MKGIQRALLVISIGAGVVLLVAGVCLRMGSGPLPSHDPARFPSAPDGRPVSRREPSVVGRPSTGTPPAAVAPLSGGSTGEVVDRQGGAGLSAGVEFRISQLKAASVRPQQFRARIRSMALRGDKVSVDTLIALSDEHHEEVAVVEALGEVHHRGQRQRVGEHLRGKIANGPFSVQMVALRSYARVMEDEGIPVLKESIQSQWSRPDGFGEMVCKAAVEGLGDIPTAAAQAALIAELDRVSEPGWLPDYGSAVVAELAKRKSPATCAALRQYADALASKMPAEDNPPGRQYYQEKIAEARAASSGQLPLTRGVQGTGVGGEGGS